MAQDYIDSNGLNPRERALLNERRAWTGEMGGKLNHLFIIQIICLIMSIVVIVILLNTVSSARAGDYDDTVGGLKALIVCAVINFILNIIYAIIVLGMGKFQYEFSSAGAFIIGSQIFSLVKTLTSSSSSGVSNLCSLIASLLTIGYVIKFCSGIITAFESIDESMADSWDSFKKLYLVATIGSLVSTVLIFIDGVSALASLGVIGFGIVGIVAGIWMIVLLHQSSDAMISYSNNATYVKNGSASAFRNVNVSGNSNSYNNRPTTSAQSKNASMSRREAIKRAEEMRQRREAKANGNQDVVDSDLRNGAKESVSEKAPVVTDISNEDQQIERLKKFKELLDSGILTQEEFDKKKKEILGE